MTMIHKMIYTDPITKETTNVDVYHFYTDFETLDCYAICWVPEKEYWVTVPIFTLTPHKTKKTLKEDKS